MFIKNDYTKALSNLEIRNNKIKNTAKIELSNDDYKNFIGNYTEIEFTADIIIFDYDTSINENRYLQQNYCTFAELVWMIGRSGQGDEWFIDKKSKNILFYDHNLGEYSYKNLINLNIDFKKFIILSDLYRQLELILENNDISELEQNEFIKQVNSIGSNLYEIYPYKYF